MKPKNQPVDRKYKRRQKAIALVIVLAMVSMMTIFMLAIFSVSRTEQMSSGKYADGQAARELADSAVNIVMAQIWDGTRRTATNPSIWASQPGAIRKYNMDGTFNAGYRLYSSPDMQVTGGEAQMLGDAPAPDWAAQSGVYADLNEPIIRPDMDGDGNPEVVFPIIDPRAYVPGQENAPGSSNVEGFWYNQGFAGVVAASNNEDLASRLPMPVHWVYVLRNGRMGTMAGGGDTLDFVPATADGDNVPSEANPIVGRIAFWTDDETSKLNINTAGEPTPWATPTVIHERDLDWAHFQPMAYEYQRYPGHPATIALSTVLFPNQNLDLYGTAAGSQVAASIRSIKERIYEVMPKLNSGGSRAATVPYWLATDSNQLGFAALASSVNITNSISERLYASVDELMFSQRLTNGGTTRGFQDENIPAGSSTVPIFQNPGQLERARFFLTAHSRMPEVNMYGLPRVAIWPIANELLGPEYRTGYDNLIAFCSKLGPGPANSYFFRRQDYKSATTDISIPRNASVLSMLQYMMGQIMPGGSTFNTKYSAGDSTQILVQIFDYIRSTNLYDGFLAPTRQMMLGDGTQGAGDPRYRWETYNRNGPQETHSDGTFHRNKPTDFRTFTPDRLSRWVTGRGVAGDTRNERTVEYMMPGHGSVVPSELGEFRGMGRFPCVSEVGFQFICSADGDTDKGSFRMAVESSPGSFTKPPYISPAAADTQWQTGFTGGRTAVMMDPMPVGTFGTGNANVRRGAQGQAPMFLNGETLFWYSNFPPFPVPGAYGTDAARPTSDPRHPRNHPGFNPRNWNVTLPRFNPNINAPMQARSPLQPGMKRVQAMLNLEVCVPMFGYGPVYPEFTIVVQGLDRYTLNNEQLFPTIGNGRYIWKSGLNIYRPGDVNSHIGTHTAGGFADVASLSYQRRVRSVQAGTVIEQGYDPVANTSGDPYRGMRNFDLISRYVTVDGEAMNFSGEGLTIEIYAGHQLSGTNPVQTYTIPPFGGAARIPVPELVTLSSDRVDIINPQNGSRTVQRAVFAPQWWSLSFYGALGRFTGTWPGSVQQTYATLDNNNPLFGPGNGTIAGVGGATLGRFAGWSNDRVSWANAPRGLGTVFGFDAGSGNQNSGLLNPVTPAVDTPTDQYTDTGLGDRQTGNTRDMRGTDVVISMVPTHGDVRHIMGKKVVPASDWMPHPRIDTMLSGANPNYFAHNISRANSDANPGFDRGIAALRLVPNAAYHGAKVPDVPSNTQSIAIAAAFGDFDNAPGGGRDGAWLNKPDEGNTGVTWASQNNVTRRVPSSYFQHEHVGADAGMSYMTPNRMMPSPVMFGSLPSRIKGGQAWRTLLFRPNTPQVATALPHPGAPGYNGGVDPADHYLLDLFWMPVVEPYAISETFSSAGKVNLNYQIVPFSHIRRSTAIHAALKGEMISAFPNADAPRYLVFPAFAESSRDESYHYQQPWTDLPANVARIPNGVIKHWHRQINIESRAGALVLGTLQQFESRFNHAANAFTPAGATGLFRTASQICEIHLIPRVIPGAPAVDGGDPGSGAPMQPTAMTNVSGNGFWANRQLTGDNTKERPYASLYGKVTTQSNTFRVFYKAQVIRKARSVEPNRFDTTKDRVSSEYRGTTLIERKLDPNDPALPDYGAAPGSPPLDTFYRFRILETKRFAP
jgi:uncharacterized protein (TIGR02600 family)